MELEQQLTSFKKNFLKKFFDQKNPDILCLNELKIDQEQFIKLQLEEKHIPKEYYCYYSFCLPPFKGYSGVAIISKAPAISINRKFHQDFDQEGRFLHAEFQDFNLISCYFPNAGKDLKRLEYRQRFNKAIEIYISNIQKQSEKPIIITGDINVCPQDIDISKTEGRDKFAGFTKEERNDFHQLLKNCNLIDSFRHFYPNSNKYSYLSFRRDKKNAINKRIDFFLVSQQFLNQIKDSDIDDKFFGSDHLPIEIFINLSKNEDQI